MALNINKPFVFGTYVGTENFIGREKEITRLEANFTHGVNTILMSPRRWGKTSLVKRVAENVTSDNIRVVYIDIFSCRDEYDFYNKFAVSLLKQTSGKFEEWKHTVTDFITRLTPKISYAFTPMDEVAVSLGITPKTHQPEEILELPQIIAEKIGKHIVVCIDEFQQVGEFSDSLTVQKRMRSVWQYQKNVSYCLFGSKRHMMENLFLKSSYPFYKFGDIIPIPMIPTETWMPYIQRGFATEGKSISEEYVAKLCKRVRNHSSYVQQYAWLTLVNTTNNVTDDILDISYQDLIDENSSLFTEQTSSLTTYQINLLRAILNGNHSELGTSAIREEYNLGSYSNISRVTKALTEKELIHKELQGLFITDPVLESWLYQTIMS